MVLNVLFILFFIYTIICYFIYCIIMLCPCLVVQKNIYIKNESTFFLVFINLLYF